MIFCGGPQREAGVDATALETVTEAASVTATATGNADNNTDQTTASHITHVDFSHFLPGHFLKSIYIVHDVKRYICLLYRDDFFTSLHIEQV